MDDLEKAEAARLVEVVRKEASPYKLRLPSPLDAETEALVRKVIGCALTVHKALGPGFVESIYNKAMCLELEAHGLNYEKERRISVEYRGVQIPGQRVDLIVSDKLIVELKAITRFDDIHIGQLVSYLKTTKLRVGLLINFRVQYLRDGVRRVVL